MVKNFRQLCLSCDQMQEGKTLEYAAAERVEIAGFRDGT